VTAASIADQPLLAGAIYDGVLLPGQTPVADGAPAVAVKLVAPRFFETMGIDLRAGRDFTPHDRSGAPKVAIVNEKFAMHFFAGRNPIGNRIGVLSKAADQEVIGVIADTKYRGLRTSVPATVYLPLDQQAAATSARTLHIRSAIPRQHLAAAIRAQIQALDKDLPIGEITSFASVVDAGLVRERLVATLATFFGALALLLVSIGLYGVIAYSVQRRTREIGIRVSLGAPQAAVVWMVMRQCVWVVAAGLGAGLPLALWVTRLAKSLLFGVAPDDPATLACAMLILIIVAALAAYLAARRAARVDPMLALRFD
jgi:predicted permease